MKTLNTAKFIQLASGINKLAQARAEMQIIESRLPANDELKVRIQEMDKQLESFFYGFCVSVDESYIRQFEKIGHMAARIDEAFKREMALH
ncbi:hypothetical protein P0Y67_07910 [Photobacterium sp. SP02]|uniref:hypothetical protein n=1 Tax=Photobacterium sp. SP02 TaxID=3032280 RepID=UPI003144F467